MNMHNSDPFSQAFDYASGATGERFQNPLWQLTEIFFGTKFKKSIARVKAFGSIIVANAIQAEKTKANESGKILNLSSMSGNLIKSLLESIDDQDVVADAALNYLSAGKFSRKRRLISITPNIIQVGILLPRH